MNVTKQLSDGLILKQQISYQTDDKNANTKRRKMETVVYSVYHLLRFREIAIFRLMKFLTNFEK
jgi:hypothetical protein